jgi:hypothetical protein
MAFGKPTKEDMKELGLDPDVLTSLKTSVDGVEDKIKNAVKEANTVTTSSIEELKNTLSAIQNKLSTLGTSRGEEGNRGNKGEHQEEEVDWLLDPEKAARKLVNDSIGGVAVATASMRADMNYVNFKGTNPRAFAKYETEIKEIWDKEPLTTKQNPKLIENIYKIVIANHIDEIAKAGETFFLEPSSGGKPHTNEGPKKKPEELLSADELDLAKKWGVTPEEYLKEKSGITGVTYA